MAIDGKTLGLALSGGGYRATLFGLGSLWRLNDAGLLGRLDRITSVSRFIFYATNLQTGRSLRFRQDMVADYLLGVTRGLAVPLATAVAAPSAFPPLFSPIELDCDPAGWTEGSPHAELAALRSHLKLADGGICDNMGLETLVDNVDIALVSDAGSKFEFEEDPGEDPLRQFGRVRDILIDQTRALRKRWLNAALRTRAALAVPAATGWPVPDYPL